ncbi:hypothetical protein [Paracoccus onubensis]|uniref:Uncharacterized protein n=1 Tax=Paracoccus onubensis TaxID=1675788 RepID=A0A418T2A1_9RHOB|nr:hypothetical protein [Paracoccus onubensis]RJE87307.1 hypothetical protein D3P04_06115 [Paracoccus onubensis]
MKPVTHRPPNPYLVLAVAIILPGVGQVLNRQPFRGLLFLFFMFLLGGYTLKTAAPDVSLLGKFSGGVFVYAMAIFDAYRYARIRHAVWQHRGG